MTIPLLPLCLLIMALVSILFYQRTANDIYRALSAMTAIICLIWGFAIAHWSIHLLCLLLLYRSNRRVSFKQADSNPNE